MPPDAWVQRIEAGRRRVQTHQFTGRDAVEGHPIEDNVHDHQKAVALAGLGDGLQGLRRSAGRGQSGNRAPVIDHEKGIVGRAKIEQRANAEMGEFQFGCTSGNIVTCLQ